MTTNEARERARLLAGELAAAADINLTADDVLGRGRRAEIVAARHQVFVELWRGGLSIAGVARVLGLDHTSVMYGMRKHLGDDAYDRELAARNPNRPFVRGVRRAALERGRAA